MSLLQSESKTKITPVFAPKKLQQKTSSSHFNFQTEYHNMQKDNHIKEKEIIINPATLGNGFVSIGNDKSIFKDHHYGKKKDKNKEESKIISNGHIIASNKINPQDSDNTIITSASDNTIITSASDNIINTSASDQANMKPKSILKANKNLQSNQVPKQMLNSQSTVNDNDMRENILSVKRLSVSFDTSSIEPQKVNESDEKSDEKSDGKSDGKSDEKSDGKSGDQKCAKNSTESNAKRKHSKEDFQKILNSVSKSNCD